MRFVEVPIEEAWCNNKPSITYFADPQCSVGNRIYYIAKEREDLYYVKTAIDKLYMATVWRIIK